MVKRISQTDLAHLELRTRILDGEFKAGTRLSETSLSEMLSVSRTPMREAMNRLVEERLLERSAAGSCYVCQYSLQDIFDSIDIRGSVEGLAAQRAAQKGISRSQHDEGEQILSQLDKLVEAMHPEDFSDYFHLNAAFHDWISRAAQSPVISREIERVCKLPLASPSAFLSKQEDSTMFRASLLTGQAQHRAIFEAIDNRDAERAAAVAREHARLARQNARHALASDTSSHKDIPGLSLISS